MTQANYTLVASGGLAVPQMDISIWCDEPAAAKEQASAVAKALHGSGYYTFILYRTAENEEHELLGRVRLEVEIKTVFVHAGENR